MAKNLALNSDDSYVWEYIPSIPARQIIDRIRTPENVHIMNPCARKIYFVTNPRLENYDLALTRPANLASFHDNEMRERHESLAAEFMDQYRDEEWGDLEIGYLELVPKQLLKE